MATLPFRRPLARSDRGTLHRYLQSAPQYDEKQLHCVARVCRRVCEELDAVVLSEDAGEPLIWCMHGLPGTGKSYVLKLLK